MAEENVNASPQEPEATAPMPVGKGIVMELVALVMVIGVTVLATVLGCYIWVVWLGMCLWASIGHLKVEVREVCQAWLGGAIGIGMGWMLTRGSSELGTWALVVAAVVVVLFIFGMVTHRWPWFANNYVACFLTVCTAQGMPLDPLVAAGSLLFGFVVFGVIPLVAVRAMAGRKQKADA